MDDRRSALLDFAEELERVHLEVRPDDGAHVLSTAMVTWITRQGRNESTSAPGADTPASTRHRDTAITLAQ